MAQRRLQHYLRTFRRRSGFSQKEIANLLGASSGTKVSRYESFKRRPSVSAIFAYEIIFDRPAREIFGGAYDAVLEAVLIRAQDLAQTLAADPGDPRTARKLQALRAIVEDRSPLGPERR